MPKKLILLFFAGTILIACNPESPENTKPTPKYSEEYYSGGLLGTTFNTTAAAYEQPTPAVEADPAMILSFKYGEAFFEKEYTSNPDGVRGGLGPVMVRSSCIACHPNYGHGKRMLQYRANEYGNGYLLVVTNPDESYVSALTGMPQTMAVYPFLPPIDETKISIAWNEHIDDWNNKFPDGEPYSLIYPEVSIPLSAFNVPMPSDYRVRLEATIGIYGTGLIDAIPDDSLLAQYQYEKSLGYFALNDAKYQPSGYIDIAKDAGGNPILGTGHPGRYTYGLTRGTLQNGPGANAIWNITNVTRSNRRYHYITTAYARAMAQRPEIQTALGKTEQEIYDYLMSTTLTPEMSDKDYVDFMVWHRGLAVPAARDVDTKEFKRGKELFNSIGCALCHRPKWQTGADDYKSDASDNLTAGKLPHYPYQTIYPYTDLLQHRLFMVNDIRTGWCRTTPLWGRGLSQKVTGASDRLHDMRARNVIEAIMWHGSQQSDARRTVEKFRELPKADREAIVKFIESI
ncbi:MAG: hypothetical protein LBG77_05165 [Dysgonamonadaceae bacterium]|jgi:CxxC motif-containing protein (DUF1111 family)|nr:hypothetical protein [Dysgonamonadaceae bacterium]